MCTFEYFQVIKVTQHEVRHSQDKNCNHFAHVRDFKDSISFPLKLRDSQEVVEPLLEVAGEGA